MRHVRSCAVIALGAVLLTGCGKSQAHTEAAAVSGTGQPAILPATEPTRTAPMPATDACPSIGTLAESRGGRIALNGQRTVRLAAVCSAAAMTEHLRKYGEGTRYILVADDLRAGVQPGALFQLSLGPPSTGEAEVLGTLNFFAAKRPGGPGQPHSISYDVTRQVQSLLISGWPEHGLGVAVAPSGEVTPGSDATVGAIRLVAEGPR